MKSLSFHNYQNDEDNLILNPVSPKNNCCTEMKSKFSSSALERFIEGAIDPKENNKGDSLEIPDLEYHDDNLIIFHRRNSGDTNDNYSINEDNFLDRSFLQLMNAVTIDNININSSNYFSDDDKKTKKRSLKKRFNTTIVTKKIFHSSTNVREKMNIKTDLFMKRTPSIFLEDEPKINHSFNSDIHLKNNKNFIPKQLLMKNNKEEGNPVQRSKSDKKVSRFLNDDDETPTGNLLTVNYYTSQCSGFQKGHKKNNKSRSFSTKEIVEVKDNNKVNLSKFNLSENNSLREDNTINSPHYGNNQQFPVDEVMNDKIDNTKTIITDNIHDYILNSTQNKTIYTPNNNYQPQFNQMSPIPYLNLNNNMPLNNLQLLNNIYFPQSFPYGYNMNPNLMINNQTKLDAELSFRNKLLNNISCLSDEELFKNACFFSKDQNGCRFLQKKLEDNPSYGNNNIFPNIKSDLIELSNDSFGNYLVQKVLETLDEENMYLVLDILKPHIYMSCINSHGTRVVQKIVELLSSNKLADKFIELIQPIILDLMIDINGNHVIQKIVSCMKKNDFIYDFILKNYLSVSRNKFGCCAMQKCIEYANIYYKQILINMIINNTHLFICDQYANYVLQYIISLNNHEINHQIATFLLFNIETLSMQKFASNVIEKIFDNSSEITKSMIVTKLANSEIIRILILDMYGNYVIQKALSIAKEPYRNFFIQNIILHFDRLKSVPYGTKLCQRLINCYPEFGFLLNQRSFNFNNNYMCNNMPLHPYNNTLFNNISPISYTYQYPKMEEFKKNNFYN